MDKKKSGLKRLFSKSKKDCCSIDIEEVKTKENDYDNKTEAKEKQK